MIRPAAIIFDVMLGDTQAWDFLIDMKREDEWRTIPIYVVSGPGVLSDRSLSRKALIVDDDEVARYVLKGLLSNTRYSVIEAANGSEGLRLAREVCPDVIFLDLVMPGMNGAETLEALKGDPLTSVIPVIVGTAKQLGEDERKFLSARTVMILSKEDVAQSEAIQTIRSALTKAEGSPGKAAKGAPNAP